MSEIEKTIQKEIETGENIAVNIQRLAATGKQSVKFIIGEILKKHNAEDLLDDIFTTVSELVFNAIKANYKYLLLKSALEKHLEKTNAAHSLKQVLANRTLYNGYMKNIDLTDINKKVRDIFKKEEEAYKIINKAKLENRDLTEHEKAIVNLDLQMMKKAKLDNIKVYLNFNFEKENVIIDLINDAPISENDLERIKEKREQFAKYLKEGREQDFYIENLDTTESAGFGLAMIDARLYKQKIDALTHFQIFGIGNKTCLTLTYPLE